METGQKIIPSNSNYINSNSDYILSIQVSLNGLSFCILENGIFIYYHTLEFEKQLTPPEVLDKITHCFNTELQLKNTFKKVYIIHDNELSTLVPKALFDEEHIADYLKFNSKILKSDYITYDQVKANDSINVYVPYVNINNYIYDRFGAFDFKHSSTLLLNYILTHQKNIESKTMYVYINTSHFTIIVLNKNELLLSNTFEYSSKEDFIYYILFTTEQLELNPETLKVNLFGSINEDDNLYQSAYTYIRHVTIFKPQLKFTLSNTIDKSVLNNFVLLNSF